MEWRIRRQEYYTNTNAIQYEMSDYAERGGAMLGLLTASACALLSSAVLAQAYPAKTVRSKWGKVVNSANNTPE